MTVHEDIHKCTCMKTSALACMHERALAHVAGPQGHLPMVFALSEIFTRFGWGRGNHQLAHVCATCLSHDSQVHLRQTSTIQRDTTRHNRTQHNTTRHGTARHDTTRHDTIRRHTTRHDTTRRDTLLCCVVLCCVVLYSMEQK